MKVPSLCLSGYFVRFRTFFLILGLATTIGLVNSYRCDLPFWGCPEESITVELPDGVKATGLQEAREAFNSGTRFFIDSRLKKRFELQHIDGAISLPYNDFSVAFQELDPPLTVEMPLIIYGEGEEDSSVSQIAEELTRLGFQDVTVLLDGWYGWNKLAPTE